MTHIRYLVALSPGCRIPRHPPPPRMDGIPDTRLVNAALYFATRNKQLNLERHCNAYYYQQGTSVEYECAKPACRSSRALVEGSPGKGPYGK